MEDTRSDRAKAFGEIHAIIRCKEKKSQEYMAMELGVSKRTVQNWEKGISSPTFFQSLEWFRILHTNPLPYFLALVYPDKLKGLKGTDSDEKINEAFDVLAKTLSIGAKRALLYLYYGEHGSSPNAILQMMLAHLHTPLQSRITQAIVTAHMYEMEKELDHLICKDNILPNMDTLNDAILKARLAALHHEYGYNALENDKEEKTSS